MRNDDNTEISIYNKMNSFFPRCNKIMKIKNIMKTKRIYALVFALLMLLPVLVSATVVISNTYPTSTSAKQPYIYLAQGPNYKAANAMGLFYASQTTSSPNNISSGTTIYINYTAGAGATYLLNVLEIVNNTPSGYPVTVTFTTLSLPSGVSMYYVTVTSTSTTGATINSLGTQVVKGTPISLPSGTTDVYLSFELSSQTSGSGSIGIEYTVG